MVGHSICDTKQRQSALCCPQRFKYTLKQLGEALLPLHKHARVEGTAPSPFQGSTPAQFWLYRVRPVTHCGPVRCAQISTPLTGCALSALRNVGFLPNRHGGIRSHSWLLEQLLKDLSSKICGCLLLLMAMNPLRYSKDP